MAFCSGCGCKLADGARFCPGCGAACGDTASGQQEGRPTISQQKSKNAQTSGASASIGGAPVPKTSELSPVIDELKKYYRTKILPLEQAFKFEEFYSPSLTDTDFEAKPMVMLIGQYSTGKTSFIKYILERDFPGAHIGPEPTTDRFVAVMHGNDERIIPGNALAADASKPFTALNKFGMAFLNKFECSQVNSKILDKISFIDTPGVLSGEKQRIGRSYDFAEIIEWFAERVDRILLLFDAHKLDISDEFKTAIEALKGHDDKIRVVLNKADIEQQHLMRVYGALMWSLGKVIKTPEVLRVYIGSFCLAADTPVWTRANAKAPWEARAVDSVSVGDFVMDCNGDASRVEKRCDSRGGREEALFTVALAAQGAHSEPLSFQCTAGHDLIMEWRSNPRAVYDPSASSLSIYYDSPSFQPLLAFTVAAPVRELATVEADAWERFQREYLPWDSDAQTGDYLVSGQWVRVKAGEFNKKSGLSCPWMAVGGNGPADANSQQEKAPIAAMAANGLTDAELSCLASHPSGLFSSLSHFSAASPLAAAVVVHAGPQAAQAAAALVAQLPADVRRAVCVLTVDAAVDAENLVDFLALLRAERVLVSGEGLRAVVESLATEGVTEKTLEDAQTVYEYSFVNNEIPRGPLSVQYLPSLSSPHGPAELAASLSQLLSIDVSSTSTAAGSPSWRRSARPSPLSRLHRVLSVSQSASPSAWVGLEIAHASHIFTLANGLLTGNSSDHPIVHTENARLLMAEQQDLLADLRSLPRNSTVRRINELVKRARLAKTHACIVNHLRNQFGMFSKEKKQAKLLDHLLDEFKAVQAQYNIPHGDFPSLSKFKETIARFEIHKFPKLDPKMLKNMDDVLAFDIPNLMRILPGAEEKQRIQDAAALRAMGQGESKIENPFRITEEDAPVQGTWSVTRAMKTRFDTEFYAMDLSADNKASGGACKKVLLKSKLEPRVLKQVWDLADMDRDGMLDHEEFAVAMYLIDQLQTGAMTELPSVLPDEVIPPSRREIKQ